MKYVITGSLGHISKPLVQKLIGAGHEVSVITSNEERKKDIETMKATPLVGSVEDPTFLSKAFAGADALYLMIPPNMAANDVILYQKKVADNYVSAIKNNNIKNVVQLSSIGAHLVHGAGPIDGVAYLETELKKLSDTQIKILRPSYFFYNLHAMAGLIKNAGIMGSNFGGGSEKLVLVDPSDIADVAFEELNNLVFKGHSVRYISGDERTSSEIAEVLSKAANKPNTPWVEFTDEQALEGMLQNGLGKSLAEAYVQMGKSLREGKMQEDYWNNKPAAYGKIKLEDFAKDFAAGF